MKQNSSIFLCKHEQRNLFLSLPINNLFHTLQLIPSCNKVHYFTYHIQKDRLIFNKGDPKHFSYFPVPFPQKLSSLHS